MKCDGVIDTVAVLLEADPCTLDRDEVAELVRSGARVRAWLDSIDVRCARRMRDLACRGEAEPAESLLGRCGARSGRDAAAVGERERVCDQLASFEAALAGGSIGSGHVDAVANATSRLDDELRASFAEHEATLLAAAEKDRVDAFDRQCRDLARKLVAEAKHRSDSEELDAQRARSCVKHWVDKVTGMHHTHLELDPLRDSKLWSIVNANLARLRQADGNAKTPWAQLQVEAFLAAVGAATTSAGSGGVATGSAATGSAADGGAGALHGGPVDGGPLGDRVVGLSGDRSCGCLAEARVPEITVLIDYTTMIDGLHEHGICETENGIPLPVSTVRRLCCDAEILPVVVNGAGEVLDAGRSRRTVNRAQRRALRAMHRTCGHPDCGVGFDACRIHHVRFWVRDRGPSDVDNLIPLCERHHHLVHEGGWVLTITPDRIARWARPDGTVVHHGTCIDRAPHGVGKRPAGVICEAVRDDDVERTPPNGRERRLVS
jgi:hypothetical protein